jgi:hypothetical protein
MKNTRFLIPSLALALAAAFTGLAHAQWIWKDASGNRVFSDKAPPPNIADKDIITRPGGNAVRTVPVRPEAKTAASLAQAKDAFARDQAAAASAAVAASAAAGWGSAPKRPAASAAQDPELVKRKQAQEAAAKASEVAALAQIAKAKQANCESARQAERNLASGNRIGRTNEKGDREFLTEAQVGAELAKARQAVSQNCN